MKITYTLVGDYYLPNLAAPESPKVGRWGKLRFNYLRKHREALYTIMLIAINDCVDSDDGENELAPFRNVMNDNLA